MTPDVQNNIAFLKAAKSDIAELDAAKTRLSRLESEGKKLDKQLTAAKKAVETEITQTITKRKDQIAANYDKEINKSQEKLKKAKSKRDKARSQGVKDRIENETAALREENRQLKLQVTTMFRKSKIPSFCNSKLYFSLFFTKGISEVLILMLMFAICFIGIPVGIFALAGFSLIWQLVLIYVIDVLVFCAVYIMINNKTKVEHLDTLKEARKNRDMVIANKRKIRSITKSIEKDKNETQYNLGKHDEKITEAQSELDELSNRKQEALNVFENQTKGEIEQEIMENNREKLETLARDLDRNNKELHEATEYVQTRSIECTDKYGSYIEQEFMNREKLDKLIEILEQGKASTISEAQQVYKAGK